MLRIAVLASGGGTDLQSILDGCGSGGIKGKVVVVVANNADAYALERARKHGAAAVFLDHRGKPREEYERELAAELDRHKPDLIVLAGWLRMLTKFFCNKYKNKIINIHPALLPKYGGRGMHGMHVHEAVLASGDAESGCSVHFVTEDVDGGPVIARMRVPVLAGDTAETLQARVLEAEHRLLPAVVGMLADGRVRAGDPPIEM